MPSGAKAIRQGNKLTVTCNNTGYKWHLTCHETAWIGDVISCGAGDGDSGSFWGLITDKWTSPVGEYKIR